jgi:hypothetical protein
MTVKHAPIPDAVLESRQPLGRSRIYTLRKLIVAAYALAKSVLLTMANALHEMSKTMSAAYVTSSTFGRSVETRRDRTIRCSPFWRDRSHRLPFPLLPHTA